MTRTSLMTASLYSGGHRRVSLLDQQLEVLVLWWLTLPQRKWLSTTKRRVPSSKGDISLYSNGSTRTSGVWRVQEYWTGKEFMKQIQYAQLTLPNVSILTTRGVVTLLLPTMPSCANGMNACAGDQQPLMCDTVWNGKPQSLKKRLIAQGSEATNCAAWKSNLG